MSLQIIGIRENPEYLERGIDYFAAKWGMTEEYMQIVFPTV